MRRLTRSLRLSLYHLLHGPGFDYHGVRVDLPREIDFTFKRMIMRGRYEEPERRLVDRFLDPSVPVVELGGSLGVLSAYVGARLDPDTPCRIVEPHPAIVDLCRRNANVARRGVRSEVVQAAIAYGVESVLFDPDPNVHVARIAPEDGPDSVAVPATTLGAQVDAVAPEGPWTLLMDIEGSEYEVLEREPGRFARCRAAIVEIHEGRSGASGRSRSDFLELARRAGLEPAAEDGDCVALVPRGESPVPEIGSA